MGQDSSAQFTNTFHVWHSWDLYAPSFNFQRLELGTDLDLILKRSAAVGYKIGGLNTRRTAVGVYHRTIL